jgi:uncharacterized protein YjbJ (UPF0337 family)
MLCDSKYFLISELIQVVRSWHKTRFLRLSAYAINENYQMNKLRIMGNWKVAKGKLKQKYGNLVGDYRTEQNGKDQQDAGRMLKRIGKAQDDVRATIDKYCC